MIQYDDKFEILAMTLSSPLELTHKAIPLEDKYNCHNLIVKSFQKGNCPCKHYFPEVKTKTQIIDHYLPGVGYIASLYGIFTIEIFPP